MSIGTRSLLFGVHQFILHPIFLFIAWWRLYGFPWDPRLWVAFFVHDLGYFGKPNMDGPEGEEHPILGARIVEYLFDYWDDCRPFRIRGGWITKLISTIFDRLFGAFPEELSWYHFTLYHSRFLSKKNHAQFSRLCVADKFVIAITPRWLYLIQANLTGEIKEYMAGTDARTPAAGRSQWEWLTDVQRYCREWTMEHKGGKQDTWTGTVRDIAQYRKVSEKEVA